MFGDIISFLTGIFISFFTRGDLPGYYQWLENVEELQKEDSIVEELQEEESIEKFMAKTDQSSITDIIIVKALTKLPDQGSYRKMLGEVGMSVARLPFLQRKKQEAKKKKQKLSY